MHGNHHRIALFGIVIARIEQPALYGELIALPMQGFVLAPTWVKFGVVARLLLPFSDAASPNLRGMSRDVRFHDIFMDLASTA